MIDNQAAKRRIKKRRATSKIKIIKNGRKPKVREESEFEKKKHADAIAFLKKNGVPKWLEKG